MKNKYTLGLVLACCMVLLACSKNEPQAPNTELTPKSLRTSSTEPAPTPYREGDLILGKKLNNPYTLANMKSAISRLEGQGLSLLKAVDLRASHFYVKFKPTDSAQYEQLQTDKRMTVYPYPPALSTNNISLNLHSFVIPTKSFFNWDFSCGVGAMYAHGKGKHG